MIEIPLPTVTGIAGVSFTVAESDPLYWIAKGSECYARLYEAAESQGGAIQLHESGDLAAMITKVSEVLAEEDSRIAYIEGILGLGGG